MTDFTCTITCQKAEGDGTQHASCEFTYGAGIKVPTLKTDDDSVAMDLFLHNESGDPPIGPSPAVGTLRFVFCFPPGVTLKEAVAYFIPLPSRRAHGKPFTTLDGLRVMTKDKSPFVGLKRQNIFQIKDHELFRFATKNNKTTINGRWGFSMDILDDKGTLYHLDDPEAQVGSGMPP